MPDSEMSQRAQQLQRSIAITMQLLVEHDKVSPAEVDAIVARLIQHVRSWRPQLLLMGGVL
ncbi:MAG TPA: hypothetical protein VFQ42_22045 [Mycobacterium sp.]|nr:hypothetical protein [Mycobacterium sp.]